MGATNCSPEKIGTEPPESEIASTPSTEDCNLDPDSQECTGIKPSPCDLDPNSPECSINESDPCELDADSQVCACQNDPTSSDCTGIIPNPCDLNPGSQECACQIAPQSYECTGIECDDINFNGICDIDEEPCTLNENSPACTGCIDLFPEDGICDPDLNADSDNDGLSNSEEASLGTDPNNPDSDNDSLSDGDEVLIYGTNPLNSDTDGDSLTDGAEVNIHLTNPKRKDTDKDFLEDNEEIYVYGTDPLNANTDQDEYLNDGEQVLIYGLDPTILDMDGDTIPDGMEIVMGLDPKNGSEIQGDLIEWWINTYLPTVQNPVITSDLDSTPLNLSECANLSLSIVVSSNPPALIKWFFTPFQENENYTARKEILFGHGPNLILQNLKPSQQGWYSAMAFNPDLNPNTRPTSTVVKVNVAPLSPATCSGGFNHGEIETRNMYVKQKYLTTEALTKEIEERICLGGEWSDWNSFNHYQFDSFSYYDCRLESQIGCSIFDNISGSITTTSTINQNNPETTISCPLGYKVVLSFKDQKIESIVYCTGVEQPLNFFIRNGQNELILKPVSLPGVPSVGVVKSFPVQVNAGNFPILTKYIENIDTDNLTPVPMRFIDGDLTQGLINTYENEYQVYNLLQQLMPFAFYNYSEENIGAVWSDNRLTQKLNFSGISWYITHPEGYASTYWNQTATLISDRHVLFANHHQPDVGAILHFFAPNGEKIEAEVMAKRSFPKPGNPGHVDTAVGLIRFLNEADIPKLKKYKFLDWRSGLLDDAKVIAIKHVGKVSIVNLTGFDSNNREFRYGAPSNSPFESGFIPLELGDSGNQVFGILNNELILLATHHGGGNGPNYSLASIQAQIKAFMAELDAQIPDLYPASN